MTWRGKAIRKISLNCFVCLLSSSSCNALSASASAWGGPQRSSCSRAGVRVARSRRSARPRDGVRVERSHSVRRSSRVARVRRGCGRPVGATDSRPQPGDTATGGGGCCTYVSIHAIHWFLWFKQWMSNGLKVFLILTNGSMVRMRFEPWVNHAHL